MPQAVDLVLNNNAAVAKTFALQSPASGDNSLALWWLKEGTISSVFPKVSVLTRATGNNSRKSVIKLKIPSSYTDSVTGLTKVSSGFELNVEASVPFDFPEALKSDAIAYCSNLMSNTLIKAVMRDGMPAS